MALLTDKRFSFNIQNTAADTFAVVRFTGHEALSETYRFDILLVSEDRTIDPVDMLQRTATLVIHRRRGKDVVFHGIIVHFADVREYRGAHFFQVRLAPLVQRLALTRDNQVFLNKSLPDIFKHVLASGYLREGQDFTLSGTLTDPASHPAREYTCQYNESHLAFLSRWAEREGIYYYFRQGESAEEMVFTDLRSDHVPLSRGGELIYRPPSGQAHWHGEEIIREFVGMHNILPGQAVARDYDHNHPTLQPTGISEIDDNGQGDDYLFGDQFNPYGDDPPEEHGPEKEAARLTRIRAQAHACRKSVFKGRGTVPYMTPGYTFRLHGHYRQDCNQDYLIIGVTHRGNQSAFLSGGLRHALDDRRRQMFYSNSFQAIPHHVQFRPQRRTPWPRIAGNLPAIIDSSTTGEFAHLDATGRYKVRLPFDRADDSQHPPGKASAWIRMAQPLSGNTQGFHLPLHKGTEVLLGFINGDLDRPVITGTVPNPDTPSPVTAENQTCGVIATGRSPGGEAQSGRKGPGTVNTIVLENKVDDERIRITSQGDLWLEHQRRYADYCIGGPRSRDDVPLEVRYLWDKFYGQDPDFNPTGMACYDYSGTGHDDSTLPGSDDTASLARLARKGRLTLFKGDSFNTQEGNIYDFGGYWNYNLGNSYEENHIDQKAELNKKWEFDRAAAGGPNHDIDCCCVGDTGGGDGSASPSPYFPGKPPAGGRSFSASDTWTSKTIGGKTYEYSKDVDTLSVEVNTREETHLYAHQSYEYTYTSDGALVGFSSSAGGVSVTKKYDRTEAENLVFEEVETVSGAGSSTQTSYHKATSTLSFHAAAMSDISFYASASFSLGVHASASLDLDVFLGAKAEISSTLGGGLSIDISAAISVDIKAGYSLGVEMDVRTGGTFTYEPSGKFTYSAIGLEAQKEAAVKAENDQIVLDNILTQISNTSTELKKLAAGLECTQVVVESISGLKLTS